eukprot:366577-Chlamydomonas_euryale.AAC.11
MAAVRIGSPAVALPRGRSRPKTWPHTSAGLPTPKHHSSLVPESRADQTSSSHRPGKLAPTGQPRAGQTGASNGTSSSQRPNRHVLPTEQPRAVGQTGAPVACIRPEPGKAAPYHRQVKLLSAQCSSSVLELSAQAQYLGSVLRLSTSAQYRNSVPRLSTQT